MLRIRLLTSQIQKIEPQFNGIAVMRMPNSPWGQRDVQLYQRYYDNLRAQRGLSAQPIYRVKMANGTEFNKIMSSKYPYNEIYVTNRTSPSGYSRVDSYNPFTREIVSRKFTQLAQIQENTAISYIREAATKYQPGIKIANVPSTPLPLRNQQLRGKVFLEVPTQIHSIPASVLKAARENNVTIRDHTGKVYQ
ncbi:MAG: hypothetical protein Q4C79_07550 [Neisseria sp.]|uniref:hypothetical protein n=1 Tax=Neisseria sp. TaxID=192066 RepID=UPI0026DB4B88|nr:hypothetical protein [Neisseria sp.]MDO4248798.1 hypothetical protein [Neisseria sp.]